MAQRPRTGDRSTNNILKGDKFPNVGVIAVVAVIPVPKSIFFGAVTGDRVWMGRLFATAVGRSLTIGDLFHRKAIA
ncbi:MAG TPA: hypothetical protein IGP91_00460 [Thermosynechococcus sp. M46_R2017_013]|nr:hypothetical protein [Thermosynechococcus sp. M46_R2017_013]